MKARAWSVMAGWMVMVAFSTLTAFPPDVQAMIASTDTETVGAATGERAMNLEKVQRFLESKVVQQRLSDFGFTNDEIASRLPSLSDAELHQVATDIDGLVPGGDGLGIIIALLVIAILVVLLLMLLDRKIVVEKRT